MSGLRHGALPADALTVCVDMQKIFLQPGEWHCPAGNEILPQVRALVAARPQQALFTRFLSAQNAGTASGRWRHYYRHYHFATVESAGAQAFELDDSLLAFASPERTFDKTTYDAFDAAAFAERIAAHEEAALVLCGVETDVCVLATLLSAVDLGHRVILVRDAVASSDVACHDAAIAILAARFDVQVEIVETAEILAAWGAG